jgi:hypothetical protein
MSASMGSRTIDVSRPQRQMLGITAFVIPHAALFGMPLLDARNASASVERPRGRSSLARYGRTLMPQGPSNGPGTSPVVVNDTRETLVLLAEDPLRQQGLTGCMQAQNVLL